MGTRIITSPKTQEETLGVTFDFTSALAVGETISSALVTAEVFSGVDATPQLIVNGPASITSPRVVQSIMAGAIGTIYNLVCAVSTSAGQLLTIGTFLAIVPNSP